MSAPIIISTKGMSAGGECQSKGIAVQTEAMLFRLKESFMTFITRGSFMRSVANTFLAPDNAATIEGRAVPAPNSKMVFPSNNSEVDDMNADNRNALGQVKSDPPLFEKHS